MPILADQSQAPMLFEIALSTLDLTSILAHSHLQAGTRTGSAGGTPGACGASGFA